MTSSVSADILNVLDNSYINETEDIIEEITADFDCDSVPCGLF